MPDNRLGDDQEIPTPRGQGFSGSDDFGVMRALDGHRVPKDEDSFDPDFVRNIHEPTGPSAPENGAITVIEALVIVVIVVVLVLLVTRL